jgi:hypothetical protein
VWSEPFQFATVSGIQKLEFRPIVGVDIQCAANVQFVSHRGIDTGFAAEGQDSRPVSTWYQKKG